MNLIFRRVDIWLPPCLLICGAQATLQITGPDEENAIREIGDLFEYEFDFPPR